VPLLTGWPVHLTGSIVRGKRIGARTSILQAAVEWNTLDWNCGDGERWF
jgi:hypothetical protein